MDWYMLELLMHLYWPPFNVQIYIQHSFVLAGRERLDAHPVTPQTAFWHQKRSLCLSQTSYNVLYTAIDG